MLIEGSEADVRHHRSTQNDPDDFDAFWAETLDRSRAFDLAARLEPVETGLATLDVFDVTFNGFEGQPVRAWLRVPRGVSGPLPAVVQFQGYGGGRSRPIDDLLWASAGFAHLLVDTRGQGSGWSVGDTPDPVGSGPQHPGFLTRGIESRDDYYYRRVFTDAVRAVEVARSLDLVDPARVAVVGHSQGGGVALAVAGLVPEVAALYASVPFLCDFPRATVITDAAPYKEIGDYLAVHRDRVEAVHGVLSYFDGVNFAKRASATAWFTTGLMDEVCPPSTVFAAFNAYAGQKRIRVWPYNGHEGGGIHGLEDEIAAIREALG